MFFKEIPGRFELKMNLIQSVNSKKVSHAQLFSSFPGTGGLAFALAYAQYILCQNKTELDSCGNCASCLKVSKLIHPDLHFSFPFSPTKKEDKAHFFLAEWRAQIQKMPFFTIEEWSESLKLENKLLNIPVSECREILRTFSMKSFEGGYKILILWLPEYLKESANSLLKLLEEPSSSTLFILVTENKDQILPTILSRTQQIQLEPPKTTEIGQYLIEDCLASKESAETIGLLSEGNLSLANSMLLGSVDQFKETFAQWYSLLYEGNGAKLVDWVEVLNGKTEKKGFNKEDKKNFLLYAIRIFRNQYLKIIHKTKIDSPLLNTNLALRSILPKYFKIISTLEKAILNLERNSNPKILFLDVSLQLCGIVKE